MLARDLSFEVGRKHLLQIMQFDLLLAFFEHPLLVLFYASFPRAKSSIDGRVVRSACTLAGLHPLDRRLLHRRPLADCLLNELLDGIDRGPLPFVVA